MKFVSCFACLFLLSCIHASAVDSTIVVKDSAGTVRTSYSAQKFDDTVKLYCSVVENADVTWSISPEVSGIDIDSSGMIMIMTESIVPKTTFTISASTTKGTSTLQFDIEVHGCQYGNFLKVDGLRRAEVLLYRNTELVFNGTVSTTYLCLPVDTYRYVITSGLVVDSYLSIGDDTGVHFAGAFFPPSLKREGSFSNDLSAKPALNFPSTISVIAGNEKHLILSSQGPIDRVTIEPELPFNFDEFSISVNMENEGVTTYTITAYHGNESTQTVFSVYCGSCPAGFSLITTALRSTAYYYLPDIETPYVYKSKQSFCIDTDTFALNARVAAGSRVVTVALEEDGRLFYDKTIVFNGDDCLLPFSIHRQKPVTFTSQLAYSLSTPAKGWATVGFNDNAWKKGAEGSWGSFTASSAWFRAPFTMDKDFSICRVVLRGEGTATVFVNGNAFSGATLTSAGSAIVIPSTLLSENNVIAVELAKGTASTASTASTVQFGLALLLTNSPHLHVSEGTASAIQASPDPKYPPESAFSDGSGGWKVNSVPAELIYTFNNGVKQVVNAMVIGRDRIGKRTYAMEIVGVNGEERVKLASFNRGSLETQLTWLQFANTRPFNSYHFVFTSSNLAEPITVFNIILLSRPIYTCPKKYGFKGIVDGTTLYKGCPIGSTGRKAVTCVHENDSTFWTENPAQCYPTNPPKDYEYLDWTFTVRMLMRNVWKADRMTEMLEEETYMRGRDITYPYMDYTMDGEMTVLTVFSRCLLKEGLGRVIKRDLEDIEPRFNELLTKWMETECTGTIESVKLRHYVNWALVIIVSVVCVLVITAVAVYLTFRQRKGDVKHLQKEVNSSSGDKESLLV